MVIDMVLLKAVAITIPVGAFVYWVLSLMEKAIDRELGLIPEKRSRREEKDV